MYEIEVLPGDEQIIPVSDGSSISPLTPIDLLYEEFTNFKIFVCQELNFIKQNKIQIKMTDETLMKKLAIETYLMRKSYCLKVIAFLLQELHSKEIIIEKLLDSIPSNSDKVENVKHLSDNQKQKVLHKENEQEKLLET